MIRLLAMLGIGLFATWQIAGADHGQQRYGLMAAANPPVVQDAPAPATVKRVVFVPAQPVMQPAVVAVVAAQPAAPLVILPDPTIPGGKLFTVAGRGANVRQGPGTTFAILDSLAAGDQVLVVDEATPTAGWSKIRIEGDGVEGYVASRLLTR